jgi:hypothetical protein
MVPNFMCHTHITFDPIIRAEKDLRVTNIYLVEKTLENS